MATLERITEQELRPGDVRKRWRTFVKLAAMYNALLNPQIITTSGRNLGTATEGNYTFEIDAKPTAAVAAAPMLVPWQPYLSPTATGPAAGRTIRITLGNVKDLNGSIWFPARRNLQIVVPPNCTDGYFVWLKADVNPDGSVAALDYDHGATPPTGDTPSTDVDGTAPARAYDLLLIVTSNATGVDLPNADIQRNTPLSLLPQIVNQTSAGITRAMVWIDRFIYSQGDNISNY